jgi:hypothetical protein
LVPDVSIDTPGVKRTSSVMSRMPFSSRVSWLRAVMLIGTLLMLSSRRVAVTTISCSALDEAPVSLLGVASLAQAVVSGVLDRMLQKSNNERQIGAASSRERMAGIVSPNCYMSR